MRIRYARPRCTVAVQLERRYGPPSPWLCPLHSLQLDFFCHACGRVFAHYAQRARAIGEP